MALQIEANETILKTKKTRNQDKIIKPITIFNPGTFIARPDNTPNEVAIPFPPLNCKNIVQLWPQIQHNPIKIRKFCACHKTG